MTSTTHGGDLLTEPRRRSRPAGLRLRFGPTLFHCLAPLAALGVLLLLLDGHGVSWAAGLLAGSATTAWLVGDRTQHAVPAHRAIDHGDGDVREQLSLLEPAGWHAVHDLDACYARYRHVAIGPGGVAVLQSQRLAHPWRPDDPRSVRELLILRRRALSAAASLRREIEDSTGRPGWVQPVVVLWSDFSAGCVQDGRCVFVSGPRLVDWLRRRPPQLSSERATEIHAALERLAA